MMRRPDSSRWVPTGSGAAQTLKREGMVAMKGLRRGAVLLTLVLLLLLALSFAPALAATDDGQFNSGAAPTSSDVTAGVTLTPPPTWITCWSLSSPSSVRGQFVYDFSADAWGSVPTTFPGGTFSGISAVAAIGNGWLTWNPQIPGKHVAKVYTPEGVTITFAEPQGVVGVVAEPNRFQVFNVTIEAYNAAGWLVGSYTRAIAGDHGAAFLGLWSYMSNITTVKVFAETAAAGFAFSDLWYGAAPVGSQRGHTRY